MNNQRILSGNQSVDELKKMSSEQIEFFHSCIDKLTDEEIREFKKDTSFCYTTLDLIYKTEKKIREVVKQNEDDVKSSKTRQYFLLGITLVIFGILFFNDSSSQTYLLVLVLMGVYTLESNQKVLGIISERTTKLFTLQSTFTILIRDFISLFGTSYSLQNLLGINLVKEIEFEKVTGEFDGVFCEKIEIIQKIMNRELELSLLLRHHNFRDDKDFSRYEHMSYGLVDLDGYYNL